MFGFILGMVQGMRRSNRIKELEKQNRLEQKQQDMHKQKLVKEEKEQQTSDTDKRAEQQRQQDKPKGVP